MKISPASFVAAVAYSASNRPEAVPLVFKDALTEMKDKQADCEDPAVHEERLHLARRFRDALFQAGLLSGYPRVRLYCAELEQKDSDLAL